MSKPDAVFSSLLEELNAHKLSIGYGSASRGGSLVTVCAPLPEEYDFTVGSNLDTIKSFLVISTDYKGSDRAVATKGGLRAISNSTFSLSMAESSIDDLMKNMKSIIKAEKEAFERLLELPMPNKDIQKYFCGLLGVNLTDIGKTGKDGAKIVSTKTENILTGLSQSYADAKGSELVKGTAFGAYCAVLYYATHLKTVRDTSDSGTDVARATSNLIGDANRMKVDAYELIMAYANRPAKAAKMKVKKAA